jgi:hypothetical protein
MLDNSGNTQQACATAADVAMLLHTADSSAAVVRAGKDSVWLQNNLILRKAQGLSGLQ